MNLKFKMEQLHFIIPTLANLEYVCYHILDFYIIKKYL